MVLIRVNIDRSETKRILKGKSLRTPSNMVEIFPWLLRNGTNGMDIDGVKTKVLIQHYQIFRGPKRVPCWSPDIQGSAE